VHVHFPLWARVKRKAFSGGRKAFQENPDFSGSGQKWCFVVLYPVCRSLVTVIWAFFARYLKAFLTSKPRYEQNQGVICLSWEYLPIAIGRSDL
jgi:hypothetical protein